MFSFSISKLRIRVNEFWEMTPYEMNILLDNYVKNEEEEEKKYMANSIILAWNIANYSNAKKLPNLANEIKKIYKENKKINNKKRMSEEEIEKHYNKKVVK